MESPWDGGTKVCSNGPGHMTEMAAMPIYSKKLRTLLLRTQKAYDLKTLYATSSSKELPSLFKWLSWVDRGLFYGNVKYGPLCFCMGKKLKQWIFSETIVVSDLKLATDDWNDKKFLLTSKRCPMGAVSPLPRDYIHVFSHKPCITNIA